jgi:hypothetical protein
MHSRNQPVSYPCTYMAAFKYMSNSTEIMLHVVDDLVKPFRHVYHHIFTDKAYTGVKVASTLLACKTYMTGAIKTNAWGLPKDLLFDRRVNPDAKHMSELNRCPRGTF